MKEIALTIATLIGLTYSCITSRNGLNSASENINEKDSIMAVLDEYSDNHFIGDTCNGFTFNDTLAILAQRVTHNGGSFDVIRVNLKLADIQFFYCDDSSKIPLRKLYAPIGSNPELQFIMNGGMYSYKSDSASNNIVPTGLYTEKGIIHSSIDTAKNKFGNFYMQPNGIFLIDTLNIPYIIPTNEYESFCSKIWYATQSGPLLVFNGEINRLFNERSNNKHIRNAVGIVDSTTIVFAISNEPVTFYQIASLFRDKYYTPYALYLDGAISGAIIPSINRNDSYKEQDYAVLIGASAKRKGGKVEM